MNEYADFIKGKLDTLLSEMDTYSYLFSKNPEKDFIRKRKLDFKEMLYILPSMGGNSLKLELMEYFSYDLDTATSAAFVQQREKLLPEAFQFLFHEFTKASLQPRTHNGYRLLAIDGSGLCIIHNHEYLENYFPNGPKAVLTLRKRQSLSLIAVMKTIMLLNILNRKVGIMSYGQKI